MLHIPFGLIRATAMASGHSSHRGDGLFGGLAHPPARKPGGNCSPLKCICLFLEGPASPYGTIGPGPIEIAARSTRSASVPAFVVEHYPLWDRALGSRSAEPAAPTTATGYHCVDRPPVPSAPTANPIPTTACHRRSTGKPPANWGRGLACLRTSTYPSAAGGPGTYRAEHAL